MELFDAASGHYPQAIPPIFMRRSSTTLSSLPRFCSPCPSFSLLLPFA